jgi:translation initiation factor IF-2
MTSPAPSKKTEARPKTVKRTRRPAARKKPAPKPAAPAPAPEPEEGKKRAKGRRGKEGDQEARKTKSSKPRYRDRDRKKQSGMTFTDFTAGGTYSGSAAGLGVDYRRRTRKPRPYGRRKRTRTKQKAPAQEIPPEERKAELAFPVTVRDLSAAIRVKSGDIIADLMNNDVVATINQPIPNDMAKMIALEYGWELTVKEQESIEEEVEKAARAESDEHLVPRIPVVTMLGHVDHGKTSLLDRIRETDVVASESAGITQHIGAYHVNTPDGNTITFLDTPGHEAFTAMRARGANCTDIVILVVAADDGVMPQTEEAISHARAADVPIIVALNKMDLPGADPQRVKPQLGGAGLELDEWGGDVPCVEVSAETGQGIEDLLEMTHLVAELRELKANPDKTATGVALEGHMMEGRGPVGTVLIREGTLKVGDTVLCGATYGRVRSMLDDRAHEVESAGPSMPVQISGLSGVPEASDQMLVVDDLQQAREVADLREQRSRKASLLARSHVTLENLFGKIEEGKAGEVRVILKGDVKGSLEPLKDKLTALSTDEVKIRLLHTGVGAVNESDVLLADASDAIIIAYRVVADTRARRLAEEKNVDLRFYQVIFQPVDDMRSALSGLLEPERRETVIGHANVLQVFKIGGVGNVAGCQVVDGNIARDAQVRVARDGVVIRDNAEIASLKRVKEDVREVATGSECGLRIANFEDVKEGDVIEAYRVEEIARTL